MKKIIIGGCFDFGQCGALGYKHWAYSARDVVKNRHIFTSDSSAVMVINDEILHSGVKLPTLHLPIGNDLKRHGGKWFDMILSGEKPEEYRLIKRYNIKRLAKDWDYDVDHSGPLDEYRVRVDEYKPLKVLHLTNGYGHHRPQLWTHIEEITIGRGKPEWGAPEHDVFIIKLGEVFHTKNLKVVN